MFGPNKIRRFFLIAFVFGLLGTSYQNISAQESSGSTNARIQTQDPNAPETSILQYAQLEERMASFIKELAEIKDENEKLKADLTRLAERDKELNERIDFTKDSILVEVEKKALGIYMIGVVILFLCGATITSYIKLKKWITEEMKRRFVDLITGEDLRYFPVRIPSKLSILSKHLEKINFKSIKIYNGLSPEDCLSGCVVIDIPDDEAIDRFKLFLIGEKPDPTKVGYVLYTTRRIPAEIVEEFSNLTFSNSLATLAQNIFTVARVLKQTGTVD